MKYKIFGKIVVLFTLLALMLGTVGTAPAQAAGPYTHSWFAEMAVEKLQALDTLMPDKDYSELVRILNKYPGVVNYGALFPDLGYTHWPNEVMASWSEGMHDSGALNETYCNYARFLMARGYSDNNLQTYKEFYLDDAESENPAYEHKTPTFREALIAQLLPSIQNAPHTEQAEKDIAFLFGLISHQESDTPFHWGLAYDRCGIKSGYVTYRLEKGSPVIDDSIEHPAIEYDLDVLLFGYDHRDGGENLIDFSYYSSIKEIVRSASSATPGMTSAPASMVCTPMLWWTYCTEDKFDTAEDRMMAVIGNVIEEGKKKNPDDSVKNAFVNHLIGGLIDGTELTAVVWAKTWDDLMKDYSAPDTTLSLNPAQADGNNGWYVTQPVMVELNAAGDLPPIVTQYRDGDNPLQQFTGLFAITSEGIHDLYYFSTNAQGMAEAAKEQIVKIDLTPPAISGEATTLPNGNGWYNTDVIVRFAAEDWVSGLDTLTSDQTLTGEGAGQSVTGTAVDLAGNSASLTVEPINIDKTPPVVNVSVDKARYTRSEPFASHFSGSDTLSGLGSLTAQFNGQPVTDGQSIDLFWLPLGTYTLSVRAEDMAGNVTETSQSIELVATLDGLKGTVARLCAEGYITKSGTCNDLSTKLDAALAAHNRGNDKTAVNLLSAFQNAVRAQTGKSIQEGAANLLLLDSANLGADLGY